MKAGTMKKILSSITLGLCLYAPLCMAEAANAPGAAAEAVPAAHAPAGKQDSAAAGSPAETAMPVTKDGIRSDVPDVLAPDPELNAKEKKVLEMVRSYGARRDAFGSYMENGKLVFVHDSDGGTPTIITAPLQVTDIELQRGERLNEIVIGDTARWQIDSGTHGDTAHIFVKPIDSALETNAVVTTDRRVYHFKLLSRQHDYVPYVGFTYQQDLQAQLAAAKAEARKRKDWMTTNDGVDLSSLDFGYELEGDQTVWRPERVYSTGSKMYIQLPAAAQAAEFPALMVRKGQRDILVNYRVRNGRIMEVDGVFPHLALVVGVGRHQEIVEIYKIGARGSTRRASINRMDASERGR